MSIARHGWATSEPVRHIFHKAFTLAGLPYVNSQSFRSMLVRHAMALNLSLEEIKAWSQNLGHADVLTSLTGYGAVPTHRQAELVRAGVGRSPEAGAVGPEKIAMLEALVASMKSDMRSR